MLLRRPPRAARSCHEAGAAFDDMAWAEMLWVDRLGIYLRAARQDGSAPQVRLPAPPVTREASAMHMQASAGRCKWCVACCIGRMAVKQRARPMASTEGYMANAPGLLGRQPGAYLPSPALPARPQDIRVPFVRPVEDEREARSALTMMAQVAWEAQR